MDYIYVFGTIIFTVYGQCIVKWKMSAAGSLPSSVSGKFIFLLAMLVNPWILSAFLSALLAALFWMAALTRFDLSYAYPFMGISFVLVLLLGALIFHEPLTLTKILGAILVVVGILIGGRG